MDHLGALFFRLLMYIFALGALGCAITIPLAAYKFLAVLFEKDKPESEPESSQTYEVVSRP